MALHSPILDDRSYGQLRDELIARIPVYAPSWTDHHPSDPGITLLELVAFLGENLLYRFNQIPDATRPSFLQLLQVPMRPAHPATGLVRFEAPRVRWSLGGWCRHRVGGDVGGTVVVGFVRSRGGEARAGGDLAVEPPVVEPVDVLEGGELDIRPPIERLAALEQLRATHHGWRSPDVTWWRTRTMNLDPNSLDFIELLTERDVRFMVVGGYAVAVHGHPRDTGDLDLWLLLESGNAASVIDALDVFGFPDLEVTAEDRQVPDRVVQIGRPPLRIDLLTSIDGVRFEDCWPRRLEVLVGHVAVPFLGLDDLRATSAPRVDTQDLADLDALEGG